jgi:DNA end-binding protein Ku
MPASAPSRSTATISLGWGLVVIPTKLFSGTEDAGIKRSEYVAVPVGEKEELHKVGRKMYDKVTGDEVQQADVVKMFELGPESVVPLTDDEIATVVQAHKGVADIVHFLPLDVMGSGEYVVDSLMQIRPAQRKDGRRNVPDPAANKAFALLMASMKREGVFGLVAFTLRGKPKYAALMPNGRLYTLKFDEEVREDIPMPEAEFSANEVEMGRMLIRTIRSDEAPVLSDEASAKVRQYVEAKAGGEIEIAQPAPEVTTSTDLMAALEASLASATKGAA